jgi:hypothetical protein
MIGGGYSRGSQRCSVIEMYGSNWSRSQLPPPPLQMSHVLMLLFIAVLGLAMTAVRKQNDLRAERGLRMLATRKCIFVVSYVYKTLRNKIIPSKMFIYCLTRL